MKDLRITFIDHLARYPTASAALEAWCRDRLRTDGPLAVTVLDDRAVKPSLRYRRVAIHWANIPVSRATNWYCPDHLPPGTAHSLLTTTVPFGTLLRDLTPQRRIMDTRVLNHPDFALKIRASLSLPDGQQVSMVHEWYHRTLLTGP